MRTFAGFALGSTVLIVLFKLFLPFVGVVLGLLITAVKFALIAFVAYMVYNLVFKRRKEAAEEEA